MLEKETNLDPLQKYREDVEAAFGKVESRRGAVEILGALQGAIAFFEEGLKLGKDNPEGAETLIAEIRDRLAKREHQIAEQLYPARRR